jgi:hypothetical protein
MECVGVAAQNRTFFGLWVCCCSLALLQRREMYDGYFATALSSHFLFKERLKCSKTSTSVDYGVCFSKARCSEPCVLCWTEGCILRTLLALVGILCYKTQSRRWKKYEKTQLYVHFLSQHGLTPEKSTTWYHYVRFSLPPSQTCFRSNMLVNHSYSAGCHK